MTLEDKIAYDSYNYKYILRVDISKFYHSIYTHSITWALIGDIDKAFNNRTHFGNKLDSLLEDANHCQTNGIPIGPIISDIIAEIILAGVDISVSNNKKVKQMDFVAIRFKDDYRFLFNTKEEAEYVLEVLEEELHKYNLWINKEKTNIEKMPAGLERKWKKEYNTFCNLSYDKKITIDDFQRVYFYLIEIEEKYPGTGMLSKFFDSLIDNKGNVIFKKFHKKNKIKAINLLSLLVDYSPRILPQLLSIIELIINFDFEFIKDFINKMYFHIVENKKIDKFRLVWLYFFAKKHNIILENNEELKNKKNENKKLSQQEMELDKILKTDPFIQYIDNKKPIFDYEDDRLIIYKDSNRDDFIYNHISVFGKKIK
ncbi:hypothetical protein DJ52_00585 [Brachyspira murdochii]|uniref:Reverse transcriptase domain-containing protein n=1 Tax=Brachyspira murdochii TaxID=84378 RepID=A0ABX5B752_9SPIR|nr:hypothetical protein DJ52_00585 [Brachyspira murdochii]